MKKISAIIFLGALASNTTNAFAGEHSVGLGYGSVGDDDLTFNSAVISYGYQINQNWAVDLNIQGFNTDDSYGGIVFELDYAVSGRVKGGLTTSGGHFLYLSGGYVYGTGTISACGVGVGGGVFCFSESGDLDGPTAGLGADFKIADNWSIDANYQRSFGDLDGGNLWTATVRYRF
jgi:hypothetical protein